MEKAITRRSSEVATGELSNLSPLLQRIYHARGIRHADDLDRELKSLLPYHDLLNIDKAAARLAQAVREQQRILIVGDFDADGATSTAVAVSALHAFGAKHIDYLVPNRFEFGYGLTPEIVDVAQEKQPNVIITVDNGISSIEGVARANELNIDVVVTDHHLPGDSLPDAYAIVNPNQENDPFASKCMAGVGVIFYVMLALRAQLKNMDWFANNNIPLPNMSHCLDLVALGTVADVVGLDKNNRIMVHQGLSRIRAGLARPGISALIAISGRETARMQASDLGFAVGPRLNAAGRLDDMSLGIACLLSTDESQAEKYAQELDTLNHERRAIESQMQQEAFAALDSLKLGDEVGAGICLFDETWHQGVVGLVASRVKEKYHRPTIAFAKMDDENIKGSARSIPGLHIRDALDRVAKRHPDLISKFGGHAMAAGLSLRLENFKAFQQAFTDVIEECVNEETLRGCIQTDGELQQQDITLKICQLLREAGPWGQGFPEPLFDGVFDLFDQRIVGERHLKATLRYRGSDYFIDAIAFNVDTDQWPNYELESVHIVYRLDINEYRGRQKLQFIIEQIQAPQNATLTKPSKSRSVTAV